MRVSDERAITSPRGTATVTPGTPVRAFRAVRGERLVPVSPRAIRLVLANVVVATAALIWLLPAPWGGLVPVVLLAQLVWFRQGGVATVTGVALGGAFGAGLGYLLGLGDWRRTAFTMLLLVLPAMAAWPARGESARR